MTPESMRSLHLIQRRQSVRSCPRSQRDLLQSAPGSSPQTHQQSLAHCLWLSRLPRADPERTLPRLPRGQCVYRIQSEPPRRAPYGSRRGRYHYRPEPAGDVAGQLFLERDYPAGGECDLDHHSQPDYPAASEFGKHGLARSGSRSQRTVVQFSYGFGRLSIHPRNGDEFLRGSCSRGLESEPGGSRRSSNSRATSSISRHATRDHSSFLRCRDALAGTSSMTIRTPCCCGVTSLSTPPPHTPCTTASMCLCRWRTC